MRAFTAHITLRREYKTKKTKFTALNYNNNTVFRHNIFTYRHITVTSAVRPEQAT